MPSLWLTQKPTTIWVTVTMGNLYACDFFTVETARLQRLHVLFFIEIASRKVHLGGITANPAGEWVAQQARNLAWKLQDGALTAKFLLRDRDSKFTAGFDQVFRSEGVEVLRLRYRAPRANSIAERFVGTCRREVLDNLPVFSARHLEAVINGFLARYHQARPHLPALIPLPAGAESSATTDLEGYSTSTPQPPDRVGGSMVTAQAAPRRGAAHRSGCGPARGQQCSG